MPGDNGREPVAGKIERTIRNGEPPLHFVEIGFLVPNDPGALGMTNPVPFHREGILEFNGILRMNFCALLQGQFFAAGRGEVVKRLRIGKMVGADNHPLAAGIQAVEGIVDLGNRLIGDRAPAVDVVILLPEPALELQSDLARVVGPTQLQGGDGGRGEITRQPREQVRGQGANAEITRNFLYFSFEGGVVVDDADAARGGAPDFPDLGPVANDAGETIRKGIRDAVHAAHRSEHGALLVQLVIVRVQRGITGLDERLQFNRRCRLARSAIGAGRHTVAPWVIKKGVIPRGVTVPRVDE